MPGNAFSSEALTEQELAFLSLLQADMGQSHLFEGISSPAEDEGARRLVRQLMAADQTTAGGLGGYISRAKGLLKDAKDAVNPFEGCKVAVPSGLKLQPGTEEYMNLEAAGAADASKMAFCLVAGGLGERLGYPGIKVALPVDTQDGACMLEYYCQYIQEFERLSGAEQLPLAIMTSGDTHALTEKLLEENNYFGMKEGQITLMQQDKVPALGDSEARIAVKKDDRWTAEMKPHGHGDVHTLLLQSGLAKKWKEEGREWLMFFQDTNPLVFKVALAFVGASKENGFAMNSMAVGRVAGEAAGALCELHYPSGQTITCNVEYNQLGPLLQPQGGDVAGPDGLSPYPGNINCLLFNIPAYVEILEQTQGVVPEFVNPKYTDATRTGFKSPTRLECMMQDYARLMGAHKLGFTQFERWCCFTAVKNATKDAVAKASAGLPPDSAFSAEKDVWACNAKYLEIAGKLAGHEVQMGGEEEQTFLDVKLKVGARVSLAPSFGGSLKEISSRLTGPVKVSGFKSSLKIAGPYAKIGKMTLDGAMEINNVPVEGVDVKNSGWEMRALTPEELEAAEPSVAIRGYTFEKNDTDLHCA